MRNITFIGAALLAIAIALPLALQVAPVSAHADYDRSTPNKDEVVQTPPTRIDAFFTQEIQRQDGAYHLRVFDEAETTQVSTGDGTLDDDDRTHMFAEFTAPLAAGKYVVRWQTLSADDQDSDSGGFCFYVQVEPTQDQELACSALEASQPTTEPTAGADATATPPAAEDTPAGATPAATAVDGDDDDGGTSTGVVIGAIIAAIAVAGVLAAAGWYFIGRRQS